VFAKKKGVRVCVFGGVGREQTLLFGKVQNRMPMDCIRCLRYSGVDV